MTKHPRYGKGDLVTFVVNVERCDLFTDKHVTVARGSIGLIINVFEKYDMPRSFGDYYTMYYAQFPGNVIVSYDYDNLLKHC